MISRGDIWWADLGKPLGSEPARRRPVLVIQADAYNRSRLATVVVAVITSNVRLGQYPGNVDLPSGDSGLLRDSVVNVTAVVTVDRAELTDRIAAVPAHLMQSVDRGIKQVLDLR